MVADVKCLFIPTTAATVEFTSGSINVGEGDTAVVMVDLEGVGGTNAVGCDLTVTLTSTTGKAGTYVFSFL